MQNRQDPEITIDKTKEMRSMEIANMINEGGLGSEDYYVILKQRNKEQQTNDRENTQQ